MKLVVDLNGVIKEIVEPDGETEKEEVVNEMADEVEEVNEEVVEVAEPEKTVENRVAELENKVDELYNIILQLTEAQREKEERIEEIKDEFAAIKANPSATPVFVGEAPKADRKSRVELLKNFKSRK